MLMGCTDLVEVKFPPEPAAGEETPVLFAPKGTNTSGMFIFC